MVGVQDLSRTTRLALRIIAAKQDLINMGYPEIIAKLFYEKYGKLTPLIAKWYREYNKHSENPNWWRRIYSTFNRGHSVQSMVYLYEVGVDPESFRQAAEHEDFHFSPGLSTQGEVDEFRQELIPEIREKFFKEIFFIYSPLMQDINSGKLTDVAPYKRLPFRAAEIKYDKRRHFVETKPLKVYDNGFKWIDTGKKSIMLAETMKNCGSAGVMSLDEDRTILTLFGPTNKPHVMVTYSPNEKRISGDQCAGSTEVKPEYYRYVIDLADHLGATFDATRSKSRELGLRYRLRNKAQFIEKLKTAEYSFDSYFRFVVDGNTFYTDGYAVASEAEVNRARKMVESGELKSSYPPEKTFKTVLNVNNRHAMEDQGIHVIPIHQFLGEEI